MEFHPTELAGVVVVEPTAMPDARGLFVRAYDAAVFAKAGLPTDWPQHNVSWNRQRGTLRGMHYQTDPHPEPKLVRCTRGRVYDVAVDLRPRSPTFRRWAAVELTADSRNALFIPAGLAHGFLTLEDDCEVSYLMGDSYDAALARGVRWNDPAFAIAWPFPPASMSERDANFPDFRA
jgi:dTDP-4-dehydrorhamnose 3,5-epimerase